MTLQVHTEALFCSLKMLGLNYSRKTNGISSYFTQSWGFPGGSAVKNLPASARDIRDMGSIPGSGRPPGKGNGTQFQYSSWKNPMERGSWGLQSMRLQRLRHNWAFEQHSLAEVNFRAVISLLLVKYWQEKGESEEPLEFYFLFMILIAN